MATFLSGQNIGYWGTTDNYIYADLSGTVTRNNNTVTLSNMTLSLTSRYSNSWGQGAYSFTVGDSSTSFTVTANGTDLGSYSLNSYSFSVSASQTSESVSWSSYDGNSGSFTVTFASGGSAPSGGYITDASSSWGAGEINVTASAAGVSSTGGVSLTTLQFKVLESAYTTSGLPARQINISNGDAVTVNNGSPAYSGGITILPNKQYYLGIYAANSISDYSYNGGSIVTKPQPPEIYKVETTGDTAVVYWRIAADGGYYSKTMEYSTNSGSSWKSLSTASGSGAKQGYFTMRTLLPGQQYSILTRTRTTAGTSTSSPYYFTTNNMALYGSEDLHATRIDTLYGAVGMTFWGQDYYYARPIYKLYGAVPESSYRPNVYLGIFEGTSVNMDTLYYYIRNTLNEPDRDPQVITVVRNDDDEYTVKLTFTNGNYYTWSQLIASAALSKLEDLGVSGLELSDLSGMTIGSTNSGITFIYSTIWKTKLAYQGFGHLTYS